jgi:hypothetical protein
MKHNLLYTILLVILIPQATSAQIRTLFNNEILYGKVKQVCSSEFFVSQTNPNKKSITVSDTTYFDKQGNTTERHSRTIDLHIFKYLTKFDAARNKLETTSNTERNKMTLKYDKRGNMAEIWEVSKAEKYYRSYRLKYDDHHNLIEYDGYYESGKMFFKKCYLYNDRGFAYEEDDYDGNNLPTFIYLYTYSNYDDKGNWTSLEIASRFIDGTPSDSRIINRQITYYQ